MTVEVGFAGVIGVPSTSVRDFYSAHWKRKIALSNRRFYEWQFIEPPENLNVDSCVVAVRDGQLLGVMGLNKRTFYLAQKAYNGAELTTWIVDHDVKGQGVGAKILNFITNHFDVLIGMGISADALPVYMLNGFRFLHAIPRFVKVIDIEALAKVAEISEIALKLARNWQTDPMQISSEQIVWREQGSLKILQGNHFARDVSHLAWRYDDHPFFEYKSFRVKSSESEGSYIYVVLREEVTEDVRILHVLDILGNESEFPVALRFAADYAAKHSFWAVDMFSTYSKLNGYLLASGWFSTLDDTSLKVPHLYCPLEIRTPATTSLIYRASPKFAAMCDVANLYITKQDADLDRPTNLSTG